MKQIFPILIFCALFFYSCEDNSSPAPNNTNNNSQLSINILYNQLLGSWRLDSITNYDNGNVFTTSTIGYCGSEFTLTNNVASVYSDTCLSNRYVSICKVVLNGVVQNVYQDDWQLFDKLSPCSSESVPLTHRFSLSCNYVMYGFVENISANSLILVYSSVPLLLPSIPSGADGNRFYYSRIP